jgi:hypothetical protein
VSAFRILGALAALVIGACGGDPGTPAVDVPLTFPADPLQTLPSTSAQLQVEMRSSPQPPVRGSDAVEIRFRDAAGMPAAGLAVTVLPWMPAHGHGTSVQPSVTETEPGVFVVTPLYLYMAGQWELRTTVAGGMNDTVTPTLDVP